MNAKFILFLLPTLLLTGCSTAITPSVENDLEIEEEVSFQPYKKESTIVQTELCNTLIEIELPSERIVTNFGGIDTAFSDDYMVMAYYMDSNIPIGDEEIIIQWKKDFQDIVGDTFDTGVLSNGYFCYGYDKEQKANIISILQDMNADNYLHILVSDLTATYSEQQLLDDWKIPLQK